MVFKAKFCPVLVENDFVDNQIIVQLDPHLVDKNIKSEESLNCLQRPTSIWDGFPCNEIGLQFYIANLVCECVKTKQHDTFDIINFSAVEDISDKEQEMGFLVMDALTLLLNGNSQNAGAKIENRNIGMLMIWKESNF